MLSQSSHSLTCEDDTNIIILILFSSIGFDTASEINFPAYWVPQMNYVVLFYRNARALHVLTDPIDSTPSFSGASLKSDLLCSYSISDSLNGSKIEYTLRAILSRVSVFSGLVL